jgi:hypothetical protein
MEKIILIDHVRNEAESRRREISYKQYKTERLTEFFTYCRNCLPKHVTEGRIYDRRETRRRYGRRRKKLLDDLKEKTGCWKLKGDALDRAVWRIRFRGVFGPVIRQTTK